MFKYVGYSRVIRRIGLEANGEYIIPVISGNVKIFGTRLIMLKMESCKFQFRDLLPSL